MFHKNKKIKFFPFSAAKFRTNYNTSTPTPTQCNRGRWKKVHEADRVENRWVGGEAASDEGKGN